MGLHPTVITTMLYRLYLSKWTCVHCIGSLNDLNCENEIKRNFGIKPWQLNFYLKHSMKNDTEPKDSLSRMENEWWVKRGVVWQRVYNNLIAGGSHSSIGEFFMKWMHVCSVCELWHKLMVHDYSNLWIINFSLWSWSRRFRVGRCWLP